MLKLIRNTLGNSGTLVDGDGLREICWEYVTALHNLRQDEGLRLGNKLKQAHVKWWQQKMKVNLAAQTLSSSVADAIDYCRDNLKLPQFKGSEATVKFIRVFDQLFDILNSRNPCAKGYKAALRRSNKETWDAFFEKAYSYIMALQDTDGNLMYSTRKKTGFIGFLVAIKSMKHIFFDLVEKKNAPMKYVLTYKFSQDHLELFFGAIRSSGGFNNNPTAQQFTAAYKRLLLRSSIQGQNGNCQKQDQTDILEVISDSFKTKSATVTVNDTAIIRKYELEVNYETSNDDDDLSSAPHMTPLSEFKTAAISYIAGYVVQMVKKKITCPTCCEVLSSAQWQPECTFIALKDRGKLIKPTASVLKICLETERCFQRMLNSTGGKLPQSKGLPDAIVSTVLSNINKANTFPELDEHMLDTTVDDNHVFTLVKTISRCYSRVRFYHLGKSITEQQSDNKVRKRLTKLVLFNHQ